MQSTQSTQSLRGGLPRPAQAATRRANRCRSQPGPRAVAEGSTAAATRPKALKWAPVVRVLTADVREGIKRREYVHLQRDLHLLDLVQQAAAGEAEAANAAAIAAAELSAGKATVAALESELQILVANDLMSRGQMHAFGLLEYAEWRLFQGLDIYESQPDRKAMWGELGRRWPSLEACILEANPTWKAETIADKVVEMHSHLLALAQSGDMPAGIGKVLLVVGILSEEEVRFLQCLAKTVHCRVALRYRQAS